MAPIVRMMKRYINMPLKYALPLLFVCAMVFASTTGCVNNTATPTPQASRTHDALLVKYMDEYGKAVNIIATRNVAWANSTSAKLFLDYEEGNKTVNSDNTITVFSTTADATNYVNAMNKTKYSLSNVTNQAADAAYRAAEGHAPQISQDYVWNDGGQRHDIIQLDTIVHTITTTTAAKPSPTPTPVPTPTPAPTATPAPQPTTSSENQLRLSLFEALMEDKGYTIVTQFTETKEGSKTVYKGAMRDEGGRTYQMTLYPMETYGDGVDLLLDTIDRYERMGYVELEDTVTMWTGARNNEGVGVILFDSSVLNTPAVLVYSGPAFY